jgi:hypothetical protein
MLALDKNRFKLREPLYGQKEWKTNIATFVGHGEVNVYILPKKKSIQSRVSSKSQEREREGERDGTLLQTSQRRTIHSQRQRMILIHRSTPHIKLYKHQILHLANAIKRDRHGFIPNRIKSVILDYFGSMGDCSG